jgi:hypothetical protein
MNLFFCAAPDRIKGTHPSSKSSKTGFESWERTAGGDVSAAVFYDLFEILASRSYGSDGSCQGAIQNVDYLPQSTKTRNAPAVFTRLAPQGPRAARHGQSAG